MSFVPYQTEQTNLNLQTLSYCIPSPTKAPHRHSDGGFLPLLRGCIVLQVNVSCTTQIIARLVSITPRLTRHPPILMMLRYSGGTHTRQLGRGILGFTFETDSGRPRLCHWRCKKRVPSLFANLHSSRSLSSSPLPYPPYFSSRRLQLRCELREGLWKGRKCILQARQVLRLQAQE